MRLAPSGEVVEQAAVPVLEKWQVIEFAQWHRSVSFEDRLLLCNECVISTVKILGLHADSLSLGLCVDGFIESHSPFLVQQLFCHGMSESWTGSQRSSKILRFGQQVL